MQKFSTTKAFLFMFFLFVLIAVTSFAAFKENEQRCPQVQCCLHIDAPVQNGEMIWDVISRQLITLLPT